MVKRVRLFFSHLTYVEPKHQSNEHNQAGADDFQGLMRISSVQLLSRVQLFGTPWTAARQASLSITNSRSSLRLTSIELVMPSTHLILCHPLLLLPSIFPSVTVFSNESILRIRWPKYWSFSFSFSPSNEYSKTISTLFNPIIPDTWYKFNGINELIST